MEGFNLKRCLLCLHEPKLIFFSTVEKVEYVVKCSNCGLKTNKDFNSIKNWNNRLPDTEDFQLISDFDIKLFEEYNKETFTYEFFKLEKAHYYRYLKPLKVHLELMKNLKEKI